ncbi:hypothetical protein [Alloactinosynnema sp. L-07]|nr:hypothetical protein [Alloactinosynnema sp. L-07]
MTNHGAAKAPVGSHLAVHYRQSNGDIDASASLSASAARSTPTRVATSPPVRLGGTEDRPGRRCRARRERRGRRAAGRTRHARADPE